MVGYAEGIVGILELPADAFGHVLSYLRIMAVLLAKGGMAFVVNLLVFGAYSQDGSVKFMLPFTPDATPPEGAGSRVSGGSRG